MEMFGKKRRNRPVTSNCPVCGYLTLQERGRFDICPVCFWEDDGSSEGDEPMGEVSITEAKSNFGQIGSSEARLLAYVRPPRQGELVNMLPSAEQIDARQERARQNYDIARDPGMDF